MTEEIRVLIFEDDITWSLSLSTMLDESGYTIAGTANNFEDAVSLLNAGNFDIALVDIGLNHKNSGIELGKMITTLYKRPFIYITANQEPQTISQAVASGPSAYLLKPVHPSSLIATMQSAINNFNERLAPEFATPKADDDFFFVKQGAKYKKLSWSKIPFLRSEKNYTVIYNAADHSEYFIRSTLSKTLSYIIPAHIRKSFAQVNRAEAVQIPFITELAGDEVRTEFRTLTLTETYSQSLKKMMHVIS